MKAVTCGLVGRGITHSQSPEIHESEAQALGIPLTYSLIDFDVLGLKDSDLPRILHLLAGIGFAGVNVTHPFKQAALELLDDMDDIARKIGAVNCVSFMGGRLLGKNSDWFGFRWLLNHALPGASLRRVAQLGAGGAGSATAYALLAAGTQELVLHDADEQRTRSLAGRLASHFPDARIELCSSPERTVHGASGVVQATPLGMAEQDEFPVDPAALHPNQWLADVIYFPRETKLVRKARGRGLLAVGGGAMVIGQAVEAFRSFTGAMPDRDRMMRALQAVDETAPPGKANTYAVSNMRQGTEL